jgi:hypothetical protein
MSLHFLAEFHCTSQRIEMIAYNLNKILRAHKKVNLMQGWKQKI